MSDKGLLEIAHQLVVDREFRERFLIAPQEVAADLGVSAEAYRALAAVAPILFISGVTLIDSTILGEEIPPSVIGWGRGP